ncbi:MAG TPA: serine hydrolase [Flavisolibacter sp.]|nr:serine hydrolase [Flavisolibacter sp.]
MNRKILLLALFSLLLSCAWRKPVSALVGVPGPDSLPVTDSFIQQLLGQRPDLFDSLLQNNGQWNISIIYTQVDRKGGNEPVLTHYRYNIDPARYFYPASTVKMPAALLSLQKLNELGIEGLDKHTTMITGAGYPGLTPVYNDPTAEDGRPSIAHYIKKIFLVSDNDAFNRLYEFLGQEYFNQTLRKMGYASANVVHRLEVSLTEEQNRHTNPVSFYDRNAKLVYSQPLTKSNLVYPQEKLLLGKGYYKAGQVVNAPFDFTTKNRLSLQDLHNMLISVMLPEAVPAAQRFRLKEEDYRFLYDYMSRKPAESRFPQYDSSYSDAYVKFLLYGGNGPMPDPAIRIFNKPGDAYGFLTDVAYIVDLERGVEFFLSATISCNSDEIFNDNRYDYDSVGFPFMKNLGRLIYDHELARKKKRQPDLSKFRINYNR